MSLRESPTTVCRVMACFSFSLMGAGPFGALLAGAMAQWWGPGNALIAANCGMLTVLGILAIASRRSTESGSDTG